MFTVIERARKYVAKCPLAISGQNGHGATFHAAAVLVHGFALGEPDAQLLATRGFLRALSTRLEHESAKKASTATSPGQ